ncbi:hypothetical protein [Streptomyces sp. NPDC058086]|uniref:hypothetical protein n=1 Tax=Streptomyces sp. NPDC058086 TaxID=3346334 RepID=UPI0036E69311
MDTGTGRVQRRRLGGGDLAHPAGRERHGVLVGRGQCPQEGGRAGDLLDAVAIGDGQEAFVQPVGEPLGLGLVGDPTRGVPEDLTEDPRVRVVGVAAPGGVDLGKPCL